MEGRVTKVCRVCVYVSLGGSVCGSPLNPCPISCNHVHEHNNANNQAARTHVALLVHGLFNAAIDKEDMGAGFKFHHPHDHGKGGAAYWCVGLVLGFDRWTVGAMVLKRYSTLKIYMCVRLQGGRVARRRVRAAYGGGRQGGLPGVAVRTSIAA